ncbi:transcription factor GTE10-like [Panicum virgatum]|uniref:transcription factor GTE10-like n=1 Tax=Panicum virgatum TaxID=38727 RepID=UPI0019D69A9D|nr:transcription factor GTE10-like [Panicum virgatum]
MQSVKRRKMSPPLHQNQKQRHIEVPRMSPDEREQLAGRLASLAAVPGHIVEFLQQQFGGGADPEGEIEIDVLKVEDSVLFELKTRLDKFAEESLIADAGFLPKEEHGSVTMEVIRSDAIPEQDEEDVDICGASDSDSDSSSSSSSDSDGSSSGSDSDEVVSGRAPPAVLLPEENGTSAQPPPDPAPEASQSTDPESVPDDGAGSTAPPALLPEGGLPCRRDLQGEGPPGADGDGEGGAAKREHPPRGPAAPVHRRVWPSRHHAAARALPQGRRVVLQPKQAGLQEQDR